MGQEQESTREERESSEYYGGQFTDNDLANHAAFEEVREDWMKGIYEEMEQRDMYRDGYYGA